MEWIKCSDELPSNKKTVFIVYCDDGDWHYSSEIWYNYHDKCWMINGPNGSWAHYKRKVTHWMPLPNPPKE